jgi:hypothetical protein
MKYTIILISLIIFSCSSEDNIEISKKEYNQLKGINENPPKSIIIKGRSDEIDELFIYMASDSCEYIEQWTYGGRNLFFHYPHCKKCHKTK